MANGNGKQNLTPTARVQRRLQTLFRTRTPVVWLAAAEEYPAQQACIQAAGAVGMQVRIADVGDGIRDGITGENMRPDVVNPDEMLTTLRDATTRSVWIIRDLHRWIGDGAGPEARTVRLLKNTAQELVTAPQDKGRTLVILTSETTVPKDLRSTVQYVEWPMPSAEELETIVRDAVDKALPMITDAKIKARFEAPDAIPQATAALTGLRHEEAAQIVATTIVESLSLDPASIGQGKRSKVEARPSLRFIVPDPRGFENMAGNDRIVEFGTDARQAFSPEAAKFGVRPPRGLLLVGVAGCGKTLSAECLAGALGVPLIAYNVNADKGKYVGDSEGNQRATLAVLDAIGRCVVLVDEVEKQVTSDGGDAGVSQDYLGSLLRWMQDRQSEAVLVFTANRVDKLPPELLRKGRIDETFFVDLPTLRERGPIAAVALRKARRNPAAFDLDSIARETGGFSGAEIAESVKRAIGMAFKAGKKDVDTADVLAAVATIDPASVGAAERIKLLRDWCKANGARPATTPETRTNNKPATTGRAVDL